MKREKISIISLEKVNFKFDDGRELEMCRIKYLIGSLSGDDVVGSNILTSYSHINSYELLKPYVITPGQAIVLDDMGKPFATTLNVDIKEDYTEKGVKYKIVGINGHEFSE